MAVPGPEPFVSVIVPVRNGRDTIGDCLGSLIATDYPHERREIVVVDNGCTDGTNEVVRRLPVRLIREPRPGVAHARNRGVAESSGEVVVFTDADCVVSTRWLGKLVEPLQREGVSACVGEIVPFPPTTAAERYVARRKPHWQEWVSRSRVPWFLLGNSAFPREVLTRMGGFDPSGGVSCCDIDFSFRFRRAGLTVEYCPEAVVLHRHRSTIAGLFVQQMRGGRARALIGRRYRSELSWGWREELGAWSDLGSAAGALLQAIWRAWEGREAQARLVQTYVDFTRRLAQRVGFLKGRVEVSLPGRTRRLFAPRPA